VILSVCPPDNSKTSDPKVLKLDLGNDLGIIYKSCDLGVKRSKVKVTGSQSARMRSSGRLELCMHSIIFIRFGSQEDWIITNILSSAHIAYSLLNVTY